MTRAELAGLAVWPVLAVVLESPPCDGLVADGLGLALAMAAGAGSWLATRTSASAGPVAVPSGRGCRRLGSSLVIEGTSRRGRVRRWLWPGDLPGAVLRRLRVHLECSDRSGGAR